MDRKEQIEALAKAWEALGDERGRFARLDDRQPGGAQFGRRGGFRAFFSFTGTDTQDATPCLAILRDVYGEDVDVFHLKDEDGESWSVGPVTARTCYFSTSFVGRIHATTLALEARVLEGEK